MNFNSLIDSINISDVQATNLLDQLFLLAIVSLLGQLPLEAKQIPVDILEIAQEYSRNKFVELTNEWSEFTGKEFHIY